MPRKEKARRMRKDTFHAVENNFNLNLNKRGFTGGLEIQKDEGTLTLKVGAPCLPACLSLLDFLVCESGV